MLKIQLELLEQQHVTEIAQLANHPLVSKTSGVPPNCHADIVNEWVLQNQAAATEKLTFAITAGKQLAGCAMLKSIQWQAQNAELAYWLGVDFWGKGIATKAAAALRDFAFDALELRYLHAHFLQRNNIASGNILSKLGFITDTTHPDAPVADRFLELAPDVWTFVWLPCTNWGNKKYSLVRYFKDYKNLAQKIKSKNLKFA